MVLSIYERVWHSCTSSIWTLSLISNNNTTYSSFLCRADICMPLSPFQFKNFAPYRLNFRVWGFLLCSYFQASQNVDARGDNRVDHPARLAVTSAHFMQIRTTKCQGAALPANTSLFSKVRIGLFQALWARTEEYQRTERQTWGRLSAYSGCST